MLCLLARSALPISVALSLIAFLSARHLGLDLELTVLLATLLTLALALILERVLPFRSDWNRSRGDLGTDLSSAVVLLGLVDPLLKALTPVALVALFAALPAATVVQIFPTGLPFLLQLLLATLAIEFLRYWAHRLHHEQRHLWWLHALHHGSERLYSINGFRFHPLNYLIGFLISVLPLLLIGLPTEVLLGYLALSQPVLMLQHANVDLRSGPFNHIFSSNELHRWHHSSAAGEANANFGHAFILWDKVFGTFHHPRQPATPARIGLFESSRSYPARAGYFDQLRSMFSPECCRD